MNKKIGRRHVIAGAAAATLAATTAHAQSQVDTQTAPRVLNGQPVPEPSPEKSAGPVRAGRGST